TERDAAAISFRPDAKLQGNLMLPMRGLPARGRHNELSFSCALELVTRVLARKLQELIIGHGLGRSQGDRHGCPLWASQSLYHSRHPLLAAGPGCPS